MDLKVLRTRCEARLGELKLPAPFDIEQFCRSIEQRRGRRILLHPVESSAGPCGLWVAGPTSDHIFYERHTSPLHQEHIVLHEISHLLCGHQVSPLGEHELGALLFPDLSPRTVERVLQRRSYPTD